MTAAIAREREVVRASLDIPERRLEASATELARVLHSHAVFYAGEMPTRNTPEWRAWRDRVAAFEWLVSKRLYRASEGP